MPGTVSPAGDGIPLSPDTFHALARIPRRRWVIQAVAEEGESDISNLADRRAAAEFKGAVTGRDRKRVYVGLYQHHLPKLDDAGVIAYDQDRGTVAPTDCTAAVADLLDETAMRLEGQR